MPSAGPQHNPPRNIISPFAGGARTGLRSRETDIEAAAGRVPDIAHQPVMAVAAAVGKVVAADGLGVAREAPRQLGGPAGYDAGHDRLPSRRAAVGDAHERMALHQRAEDGGAGRAGGNEQPELPGDDLGGEPHRL